MPALDVATVSATAPTLGLYKKGFVIGNDAQFQRTITGLLPGDTPLNGWMTIKTSPAASDISGLPIAITQAATSQGVIVGLLATFNLQAVPSLNLESGPLYYYDVKIQVTPSNNIYTVEQGWISFLPEVTDSPTTKVSPIQQNFPPPEPPYLFGPNPPPNGNFAIGTRYIVVPPVEGFPAEWVFASSGFWRAIAVVSYGV